MKKFHTYATIVLIAAISVLVLGTATDAFATATYNPDVTDWWDAMIKTLGDRSSTTWTEPGWGSDLYVTIENIGNDRYLISLHGIAASGEAISYVITKTDNGYNKYGPLKEDGSMDSRVYVNNVGDVISPSQSIKPPNLMLQDSRNGLGTMGDSGGQHILLLKEQLTYYQHIQYLDCPNHDHVLVIRPNDKWGCVYYDTAQHLKWDIVAFLEPGVHTVTTNVLRGGQYHSVSYQLTHASVESIIWHEGLSSLFVNIAATNEGTLVLNVPINDGGLFERYCNSLSSDENFIILVNGEETYFQSHKSDVDMLVVEMAFVAGVKTIEIVNIRPLYIQC